MNTTLTAAQCDPTAWRTWLRDGARLVGRSASGWGILWLVVFIGRGYVICHAPTALGLLVFVALSGAVELAHLAVFRTMMAGKVGLLDSLRAIGTSWIEHRALIGRSLRTRLLVGAAFLAVAHTLIYLATTPSPHLATGLTPAWAALYTLARSVDATVGPLLIRLGGVIGLILPLMAYHGLTLAQAAELNRQALTRNNPALLRLFIGFSSALVLLANPLGAVLIPALELWLAATMACAYADIFDGGYQLKDLAKAPERQPRLTAVRVRAR